MSSVTATPGVPNADGSALGSPAPDWAKVPFDVLCARCGFDLRGRSEPRCPACRLRFDWADAVPLEQLTCLTCGYHLYGLRETRCPECGADFAWADVLDAYRRRRIPLFEYGFREQPLRTLRTSWWLALRPWKLWRTVKLHDPPALPGLTTLLVVAAAMFALAPPIISYISGWVAATLERSTRSEKWILVTPPSLDWIDWYPKWLLIVMAWAVAGFLALLILSESMRRCRVRVAHVFRAYTYALLIVATGSILYSLLEAAAGVFSVLAPAASRHQLYALRNPAVPLAIWIWMFVSLWLAYRLYLRMRHAFVVSLLTQVIAVLCGLCAGVMIR